MACDLCRDGEQHFDVHSQQGSLDSISLMFWVQGQGVACDLCKGRVRLNLSTFGLGVLSHSLRKVGCSFCATINTVAGRAHQTVPPGCRSRVLAQRMACCMRAGHEGLARDSPEALA